MARFGLCQVVLGSFGLFLVVYACFMSLFGSFWFVLGSFGSFWVFLAGFRRPVGLFWHIAEFVIGHYFGSF